MTITVVIRPTSSHVALPPIKAGDDYALQFAPGLNVGRKGAITVFTDGAATLGQGTIVDSTGSTVPNGIFGQPEGNVSLQCQYVNDGKGSFGVAGCTPSATPTYTLKIPALQDSAPRYDFNQPQSGH